MQDYDIWLPSLLTEAFRWYVSVYKFPYSICLSQIKILCKPRVSFHGARMDIGVEEDKLQCEIVGF